MNVKLSNKRYLAITEIYAFIVDEGEGEGVMGFGTSATNMMPMIGADLGMVERLRPLADQIAKTKGIKYEVRYFKAVPKP